MVETYSATVRCRCGKSFRMSGPFIGRGDCPHCGHRPPREHLEHLDDEIAIAADPSRCNHAGYSRGRVPRLNLVICCGCGRPVMPLMPSPEDLIMSQAAPFVMISVERVAGVETIMRRFPDGRWLCAYPLLSRSIDDREQRGCIEVGHVDPIEPFFMDDKWEFPRWTRTLAALITWDGKGEPEGWDRHPASKRYRRDGIAPAALEVLRVDSAPCESQG